MSHENIKVVQQAYDNFKQGNIDGVLALIADDVDWRLPKMENVRISGTRQGRAQVQQFFGMVGEDQEPLQFEPREYIANGDRVVALGHYKWNVKRTATTFESDFAHVFRVKNGRIIAFDEYLDTAAANAAYK